MSLAEISTRKAIDTLSIVKAVVFVVFIVIYDVVLTLLNMVFPKRLPIAVVPPGSPGAGGIWPPYLPPRGTDSRCSCPALNALANHGIIPRDGKNLTFEQMTDVIRTTYNFSMSFCLFTHNAFGVIFKRDYKTGKFQLSDVDVHNAVEHDASFSREDSHDVKDQGSPSRSRIKEKVLSAATGPGNELIVKDLSNILGNTRADSKEKNPEYTQALQHRLIGSGNASNLLTVFGGRVDDLRTFLLEERFPPGWQPRVRERFGFTLLKFFPLVLKIELGVPKGKFGVKRANDDEESAMKETEMREKTKIVDDLVVI